MGQLNFKNGYRSLFKSHGRSDIATVVRGIAALCVCTIHTSSLLIPNKQGIFYTLARNVIFIFGTAAPYAFFIVSGYALMHSWTSRRRSFLVFALERLIRLAPLYAVALAIGFKKLSLDLISLFLFLNPVTKSTSWDPLTVAWTVPIEFWCSLTIPIFYILVKKNTEKKMVAVYVVIPILITSLAHIIFLHIFHFSNLASERTVFKGILYFAFGVLIFVGENIIINLDINSFNFLLAITLFFTLFTFVKYIENVGDTSVFIVQFVFLIFMLDWRKNRASSINFNRLFLFFGNSCYGIYLSHPIIDGFIRRNLHLPNILLFFLDLTCAIISGMLSWIVIERPLIILGKKYLER